MDQGTFQSGLNGGGFFDPKGGGNNIGTRRQVFIADAGKTAGQFVSDYGILHKANCLCNRVVQKHQF
jgi:hypothetical protein